MIRTRRNAFHLRKRTYKKRAAFRIAVLSGIVIAMPIHSYIFSRPIVKLPAVSASSRTKSSLASAHREYVDSLLIKDSKTAGNTSFTVTAYRKIENRRENLFIKSRIISYTKSISILQLAHITNILKMHKLNIFTHKRIGIIEAAKGISLHYKPLSGIWYKLRLCESGSNYSLNTGNGYYGAYQFAPSTWWAIGFTGMPNQASPEVQDEAAMVLQKISGWIAWPQCASSLGLLG